MKRWMFTCCLFVLLGAGSLFAQKNIIKTNPLGLAFGNLNFTYETVLNDKSSFLASASYLYRLFGVNVNTVGLGVGYRYYLTHSKKDVPTGLYINPQIGVSFGNAEDFNYNAFTIGFEIGYQWAWESGVVLDIGIGPNYINLGGDYEDIDFDNSGGIVPSATLAIGYAW